MLHFEPRPFVFAILNGASRSRDGSLVWQFVTVIGKQSAFIVTPLLVLFAAAILGTLSTYKVMHNTNLATQNRVRQSTRETQPESRLATEPYACQAALEDALPTAAPTSHADSPVEPNGTAANGHALAAKNSANGARSDHDASMTEDDGGVSEAENSVRSTRLGRRRRRKRHTNVDGAEATEAAEAV